MEDQDAFSKVAGKWSDHEYILNGKLTGYADRPNEKCGWKRKKSRKIPRFLVPEQLEMWSYYLLS